MTQSMYEIKGMKAKHSIMKSMQVLGTDTTDSRYMAFEIEPYDNTYTNLYKDITRYDNAIDKLLLTAFNYAIEQGYNGAYVYLYDDLVGTQEHLLTTGTMQNIYKLI